MKTVKLNCYSTRRSPDPLNQAPFFYKIQHHFLTCKAKDLPKDIPVDPNPRAQDTDKSIYKKVRDSLLDERVPNFHLKNKGITVVAKDVKYISGKDTVEITFYDGDGIVDGGHTYRIIIENQLDCPDNQYVDLEVITSLPEDYIEPIAEGLNTSLQVQQMSLSNLVNEFDWIKDVLGHEPYAPKISYRENEDGDYTIRDIISFMTLFNIELFPDGKQPKIAYTSKAACLQSYLDNKNSYMKLKFILKDILEFHDYIHSRGSSLYNKKYSGKAGALSFYRNRKRGEFEFTFSGESSKTILYEGALYPILGAFRYLVHQKPNEEFYSWKVDSIDEVKTIFDNVGAEMINLTKVTSDSRGRNPNAIGKDDNHWDNLYKTVALQYLEEWKD